MITQKVTRNRFLHILESDNSRGVSRRFIDEEEMNLIARVG